MPRPRTRARRHARSTLHPALHLRPRLRRPSTIGPHGRLALPATLLVSALVLGACGEGTGAPAGTEAAPAAEAPLEGRIVSIGGGLSSQNEAVYREILEGREGSGPICVIPTAGASPESSMESAVARIEGWGGEGTARGVLISTENPESALDPAVADQIMRCGGFFFTGGVQSRIVDVFRPDGEPTPAFEALMTRFRAGAVVSGSSAGAAMMSHPMIAGGSSAPAFEDGTTGGVRLAEGMGFMPTLLADQHFLARGRIGRLIVALLEEPGLQAGVGIDEDTAFVLEGDLAWVVGASGVVLVDVSGAVREGEGPAEASGVRIELMGHGDTLDLRTLEIRSPAGKRPVPEVSPVDRAATLPAEGGEVVAALPDYPAVAAEELFERWTLLHLFHRLALDQAQVLETEAAGHRIRLAAGPGHRALAFGEAGVQGTPHGLSVGPIEVEIRSLGRLAAQDPETP
jgi:cyanophycinase